MGKINPEGREILAQKTPGPGDYNPRDQLNSEYRRA